LTSPRRFAPACGGLPRANSETPPVCITAIERSQHRSEKVSGGPSVRSRRCSPARRSAYGDLAFRRTRPQPAPAQPHRSGARFRPPLAPPSGMLVVHVPHPRRLPHPARGDRRLPHLFQRPRRSRRTPCRPRPSPRSARVGGVQGLVRPDRKHIRHAHRRSPRHRLRRGRTSWLRQQPRVVRAAGRVRHAGERPPLARPPLRHRHEPKPGGEFQTNPQTPKRPAQTTVPSARPPTPMPRAPLKRANPPR
jgi:hypothetical protein